MVGVPEIVLSICWTLITVAKPAVEIESISVPGAAHFFIAAWNSCASWLVPVCSTNGEAMYMPSAAPAAGLDHRRRAARVDADDLPGVADGLQRLQHVAAAVRDVDVGEVGAAALDQGRLRARVR